MKISAGSVLREEEAVGFIGFVGRSLLQLGVFAQPNC